MENLSGKLSVREQNSANSPPACNNIDLESPSLFQTQDITTVQNTPLAYELKFLLNELQASEIASVLQRQFAPDPFSDPTLDGAYRITSLYTDTSMFDVYHRNGVHAGTKFRARRYGQEGPIFLERKDKDGSSVRKVRTSSSDAGLSALSVINSGAGLEVESAGSWFREAIRLRGLQPVCRISYERVAYMGPIDGGIVRVTFDRKIRGDMSSGWALSPVEDKPELLPGFVICEFKFRSALPTLLKEVVADFTLAPTTISKYRRFLNTTNLMGLHFPSNCATATTEIGGSPDA